MNNSTNKKNNLKENKNSLKMDIHTKRNLELTETIRLKQRQHSLIWLLDKTKTAMGSRLLKSYIENAVTQTIATAVKIHEIDVKIFFNFRFSFVITLNLTILLSNVWHK